MSNSEDQENNEAGRDGSVWTSYSDLFMALAVVFLIMFVFTLLKSGVSEIKRAVAEKETKEYLEAKIPEKMKEENRKRIESLDKTLNEINQNKAVLVQNMDILENFVKSLGEREKSLRELNKNHVELQSVLLTSREKIEKQRDSIKNLEEQRQDLEKTIKKDSRVKKDLAKLVKEKEVLEEKKASEIKVFKEKIVKKEQEIKAQKSEISRVENDSKRQKQKIEKLGKQIELKAEEITQNQAKIRALENMEKNVKSARIEIESLQGSNTELQKKIERSKSQLKSAQSGERELKKQLSSLTSELGSAKKEIESLAGSVEGKQGENESLHDQISKAKGRMKGIQDKIAGYKNQIKGLNSEIGGFKSKIKGLGAALAKSEARGQTILREKQICLEEIDSLKGADKEKKRKIASLRGKLDRTKKKISKLQRLRQDIAGHLRESLSFKGVKVDMDSKTGVLTLRMDDVFQFNNNSSKLSQRAKVRLMEIIPAYAEGLLGDKNNASKISTITVTGFASPRYKRKFIDPNTGDQESYEYNLQLSMDRAQKIVEFMFGSEIGQYPFKVDLRKLTNVSANGYMSPVKAKGRVEEKCGIYDCRRSRRVEINFHLNHSKDIDSRIRDINESI